MSNVIKVIAGMVIIKVAFIYILINLYANPLGYPTPTAGAIGFLAFSILLSAVIYSLKSFTFIIKILVTIETIYFLIGGFLSALVCFYSLRENISYPLASSILVLGSILPLAILLVKWNSNNEPHLNSAAS